MQFVSHSKNCPLSIGCLHSKKSYIGITVATAVIFAANDSIHCHLFHSSGLHSRISLWEYLPNLSMKAPQLYLKPQESYDRSKHHNYSALNQSLIWLIIMTMNSLSGPRPPYNSPAKGRIIDLYLLLDQGTLLTPPSACQSLKPYIALSEPIICGFVYKYFIGH